MEVSILCLMQECIGAACVQHAVQLILNYQLTIMVRARFRAWGYDASVTYQIDIVPRYGNKCASPPVIYIFYAT